MMQEWIILELYILINTTNIASIIGPTSTPMNPRKLSPPTTPSKTSTGCNPPLLPIIFGFSILSAVPTMITP